MVKRTRCSCTLGLVARVLSWRWIYLFVFGSKHDRVSSLKESCASPGQRSIICFIAAWRIRIELLACWRVCSHMERREQLDLRQRKMLMDNGEDQYAGQEFVGLPSLGQVNQRQECCRVCLLQQPALTSLARKPVFDSSCEANPWQWWGYFHFEQGQSALHSILRKSCWVSRCSSLFHPRVVVHCKHASFFCCARR